MITIRRKIIAKAIAVAICAGMSPAFLTAQNPYGLPERVADGNILHCFDWSVEQITEELPAIAEAGFTSVQLSPLQGNGSEGSPWYNLYLPRDFRVITTGIARPNSLKPLCDKAAEYGIKIIVDVVANHVSGSEAHRDPKWNDTKYWHSPTWKNINYSDRTSITHDNLGQYPDLNSEHEYVQQQVKAYIDRLASLGVKGIRWDAAKHIGLPSEGCGFWPAVITADDGLFHYGEILDTPGGNTRNVLREYSEHMSFTDSRYSDRILAAVRSGSVPADYGNWTKNLSIPAEKLVYWGESHDTYANSGGATKSVAQAVIDRAWAIGACRKGEIALYLSRPFKTAKDDIKIGVKGSTHFTAPQIAAVNHFKNAMVGRDDWYTASDGVACVTRKGGGACIVVGSGNSRAVSIENGGGYAVPGTYTDRVSGNTFTVTATTISGTVGPTGIAVIYDDSQSGIDSPALPEAETAAAEYFTLQGLSLGSEKPSAPGIYIVRQGGKARKILVR